MSEYKQVMMHQYSSNYESRVALDRYRACIRVAIYMPDSRFQPRIYFRFIFSQCGFSCVYPLEFIHAEMFRF